MKTSYKIFAVLVAGLFVAGAARAQEGRLHLNINYTISTPVGDFKDFINKTTYRSWAASLLYGINDKVSVGLGTGFQDFYQKYPRDTYKLEGGGDISAVVSNSVQAIPVLAQVQYNFSPQAIVQPYVGVGVGGNLILYRQFLGEFGSSKTKFGFAARPEAGVFIPFRKGGPAGITLRADYNCMPVNYNDLQGMDNWGAGIGVKFPLQ
ncbi:outer membrane beta-barrel protein [Paraflavitalea sp. CAU 1676]|uniref:outer membrane beta-barrel protein n=1 Tax=Paraflavitalea sp. CAU 1676 TaxID=3032598 RepID=UPI0023DBC367|nr:outer membrane beta-barrel protein [Paraflavitalea sp. CAU 1676]MDF2187627.1 outer membrane beta-barrel protein [Paraflavitalea sp. CAU 1676]